MACRKLKESTWWINNICTTTLNLLKNWVISKQKDILESVHVMKAILEIIKLFKFFTVIGFIKAMQDVLMKAAKNIKITVKYNLAVR